ncbi:uncharacterized protein L201_003298 [Kwoniella dendrophila CBS 6074]|uniref:Uncharacterized protein n=1 Tax=Kwoniella dendrophila CBS 6074 TaxID=1295534 RepID=A0AAX4JSG8_9TREE
MNLTFIALIPVLPALVAAVPADVAEANKRSPVFTTEVGPVSATTTGAGGPISAIATDAEPFTTRAGGPISAAGHIFTTQVGPVSATTTGAGGPISAIASQATQSAALAKAEMAKSQSAGYVLGVDNNLMVLGLGAVVVAAAGF